jgi:hypothetical protein
LTPLGRNSIFVVTNEGGALDVGLGQGGCEPRQAWFVVRNRRAGIRRSAPRIKAGPPDGDRWHTIGLVGPVLLLVIHTWPEAEFAKAELVGRIISARKATAHERKVYEEGNF